MPSLAALRVYDNILDTIGNTPLVKLNRITQSLQCKMYGKLEFFNPGGSVKDPDVIAAANRAGLAMLLTGMRHFRH